MRPDVSPQNTPFFHGVTVATPVLIHSFGRTGHLSSHFCRMAYCKVSSKQKKEHDSLPLLTIFPASISHSCHISATLLNFQTLQSRKEWILSEKMIFKTHFYPYIVNNNCMFYPQRSLYLTLAICKQTIPVKSKWMTFCFILSPLLFFRIFLGIVCFFYCTVYNKLVLISKISRWHF